MRGATECAKRLKLFVSSLRSKLGKVSHPTQSDPIAQLILGVLSRDVPEARALEGLDRLHGIVVDYNELRVIPSIELAELLSDFPDARLKCEDISRALNKIFAMEHAVSLERVAGLPRKELLAYLEQIDGLEPYSRARIRLLGFRRHAVPLDEAMWALARREQIVAPRCPLAEAQQFLERQIDEDDALDFVALMKKHAWAEMAAAVKAREVEPIQSVPPDRTSRHMLAAVSAIASRDEEGGELADTERGAKRVSAAESMDARRASSRSKSTRAKRSSGKKPARRKTAPSRAPGAKRSRARPASGAGKAKAGAAEASRSNARSSTTRRGRKTSKSGSKAKQRAKQGKKAAGARA